MKLVLEVQRPSGEWAVVSRIRPEDRPGYITHHAPDEQFVYVFGWEGSRSYLWRTRPGVIVRAGEARRFDDLELQPVAALGIGGTHEMTIHNERLGRTINVRVRRLEL